MKLIKPSIEFLWCTENPLQTIEKAGRTCYKSEDKITDTSAELFVKKLIDRGHLAMIEHASMSYRVICDRGVTHEIVRHRLFSYAQESTRYCNYKGGVTFIIPCWTGFQPNEHCEIKPHPELEEIIDYPQDAWLWAMYNSERYYQGLIEEDWTPQQARSVLPNSLKTEIVITGNLREWMHFFTLRCAKAAHPQMQEIANMLIEDAQRRVPIIFFRKEF